jgi:hypothetical protein
MLFERRTRTYLLFPRTTMSDLFASGTPTPTSPGQSVPIPDDMLKYLRQFVARNNVLYLVSALFMLIGCYLVCLPHLFEYKQISSLLTLLGAINSYELMVIFACIYMLRKLPESSEWKTLLIVEVLFLLDATFTNNSCFSVSFSRGLIVLVSALAIGFIKVIVLELMSGKGVFKASLPILATGMIFTYSFQFFLAKEALDFDHLRPLVSYFVWLVFGTLPLFSGVGKVTQTPAVSSSAEIRAVFHADSVQRATTIIAVLVPCAHLAGQSWVHRAQFQYQYLVPIVVSLFVTAPDYFRLPKLKPWLRLAPLIVLGWSIVDSNEAGNDSVSVLRLNLIFAAFCYGVSWWRTGRPARDGLGVTAILAVSAISGGNRHEMFDFLLGPKLECLIPVLLISALWLVFDQNYLQNVIVSTVSLFLIFRYICQIGIQIDALHELLYYIPIVAFLTQLRFEDRRPMHRLWLWIAIFLCGCWRSGESTDASLVYTCCASLSLAAGYFFVHRASKFGVACYTSIVIVRRVVPAPTGGLSWGWVAIAIAFGLFALAFYATRLRAGIDQRQSNVSHDLVV